MKFGLRTKILVPILGIVIICFGVSSYMTYRASYTSLEGAILGTAENSTEGMAQLVEMLMSSAKIDAISLASRSALRDAIRSGAPTPEQMKTQETVMADLVKNQPLYQTVGVFSPQGKMIICSEPKSRGADFSDRDFFKAGMQGESIISQPYMSRIANRYFVATGAPIRDTDGTILGVAYIAVDLPELSKTFVAPVSIGEHGYAFIIDKQGQVLGYNDPVKIMDDQISKAPAVQRIVASSQDTGEFREMFNGQEVVYSYVRDPATGWAFIARGDVADLFGEVQVMAKNSIILAIIGIVIVGLVAFFIIQNMTSALGKGMRFAVDVAAGRLDGKLDVQRGDEIGQLSNALRAIPDALRKIIDEYDELGKKIQNGYFTARADSKGFSGDFGRLVEGTNAIVSQFQTVLDSIPSPVILLNKKFEATYINKIAQQLAGTDYQGKTCGELFHRDDYDSPRSALRVALKDNRSATSETRAHPRGKDMDISYTSLPLHDAKGDISAILQLLTDLTDIKQTQRTIVDVAHQASEISNRMAASSQQLSAQVEQVSRGSEVQRDRVAGTATAMEQMNSTVLEVARNAGAASEQAEETRKKAQDGRNLVEQVTGAINRVNAVASEMQNAMNELGKQAESIGGVMSVISDIADQTNLLALNAAIEAARAGEAGRGFAVVADEVRKLAEKTMTSTTEVGSNIQGIQAATATNIQRMEEAAKSVSEATALAGTSGEALQTILELADKNSSLITGIATAAEQQSATSDEINKAIDEINRIASETTEGMTQSSTAVQEVSGMAQELRTLLQRLESDGCGEACAS